MVSAHGCQAMSGRLSCSCPERLWANSHPRSSSASADIHLYCYRSAVDLYPHTHRRACTNFYLRTYRYACADFHPRTYQHTCADFYLHGGPNRTADQGAHQGYQNDTHPDTAAGVGAVAY